MLKFRFPGAADQFAVRPVLEPVGDGAVFVRQGDSAAAAVIVICSIFAVFFLPDEA